jgi:hypothetical protein
MKIIQNMMCHIFTLKLMKMVLVVRTIINAELV